MTIKQFEILRNRLDGILGSKANADLKVKRLQSMHEDLLESFDCRFALDLADEVMSNIIDIDIASAAFM